MQTVKEKLTFKFRETVGADNQVDFFVKCSVNFEKSTYKVTPIITTQHGTDAEFFDTVRSVSQAAAIECQRELEQYAASIPGGGVQGKLDLKYGEQQPAAAA